MNIRDTVWTYRHLSRNICYSSQIVDGGRAVEYVVCHMHAKDSVSGNSKRSKYAR